MPIRPENRGRYPRDWKLRSYFVRFIRARGQCEWCGAINSEPHPETGAKVVLTTAHVYDDRPEASSLLNLAALCQKCHNSHDATARQQRRHARLETESGQTVLRFACPQPQGVKCYWPNCESIGCIPSLLGLRPNPK